MLTLLHNNKLLEAQDLEENTTCLLKIFAFRQIFISPINHLSCGIHQVFLSWLWVCLNHYPCQITCYGVHA